MYEIMSADEAIRLIRDGDCICVNSFVGIENPTELHEAIYRYPVRDSVSGMKNIMQKDILEKVQ